MRRSAIAGIAVSAAVLVMIPSGYFFVPPCSIWGITGANALIAHMTADQIYEGADTVLVGKVVDASPTCVGSIIGTKMTVDVEEYLKNPQENDRIDVLALGGTIGAHGVWVEDEKIFDEGERALLFLNKDGDGRIPAGAYHVGVYSAEIGPEAPADMSLLEGMKLELEGDRTVSVDRGETRTVSLSIIPLLGYGSETELSVTGYRVQADGPNPEIDLGDYGIRIDHEDMISVRPNGVTSVPITLSVADDATPGEYTIRVHASEIGSEPLYWKNAYKTFGVTVAGSI